MTGREAAVRALLACEKPGARSDAILDRLLQKQTDPREAALTARLTAGVLQNTEACDHYLRPWLKKEPQPEIRAILRTAVYQLAFMDRIPVSAAVNEAVSLARKLTNPGAAGMVNAILRNLTRTPLPALPEGPEPESLSVRYSHPVEWTAYFSHLLDPEQTALLLAHNNQPAPVCFRVNTLRACVEEAAAVLEEDGVKTVPHAMPGFLTAEKTGSLRALRAFREGLVTVQDPAAALPAYAAAVQPGMRVLDACAAPGGKSFLLAQEMRNEGSILSCDVQPNGLEKIREGAERLGITCVETAEADARFPKAQGLFDAVLADVPCSGFGVIRKKPEIRRKTAADIAALPALQLEILEGLAPLVRPGGVLIYSTCTLITAENSAVTEAFLLRHPEFEREAMRLPAPFGDVPEGERTVWPFEHDTDGFFLCRMKKKTSARS